MSLKSESKSIGEYIIDLTPLLDVIFILLIVVLCSQENHSRLADEKYAQAEKIELDAIDSKAEAEDYRNAVQKQLENYEQQFDYMNLVTIYASYKPSNRKYRTLRVMINGKEVWEEEINPSNEDTVWDKCQAYIEKSINGDSEIPTVFAISNEKMLYRDEEAILALYDRLDIKNKFERNYTETENE